MRVVTNERIINRNKKIGQYTTIFALVVLAGGLVLSFRPNSQYFSYSLAALLLGFVLSQVGIYFGNRWGRTPRPDQQITQSLKGLDDKYSLYHYVTPVSHLLIGPAGVWILLPFNQKGTITYEKGRWKQKGGNLYMKVFAQEGLGRPDVELNASENELKRFLEKKLPENTVPEIQAALVFTSEKVTIATDDPPVPTLQAEKLKDFIRRMGKQNQLPMDSVELLQKVFEE
jgi:hypothetical protein